ncbi:GNAT family N-acetyltransferase [Fructilactobacillus vespulae]|uniref:GNAT family N-acetyltransferase n=1 Tax=Fructilactobacillus vespulae TaxID=1249630 RepID=UPI0039B445F2
MTKLRPINSNDNLALKKIIQDALKSYNLDIAGTAYFDPELDYLNEFYDAKPNRQYFVAVDEANHVYGGAGIAEYDLENHVAELQKLYLSPAARGQGLSYQLLDKARDFAKQAGFKKLYLETHHNLAPAIHVYEKYGFQEIARPLKAAQHSTMDKFFILDL